LLEQCIETLNAQNRIDHSEARYSPAAVC